LSSGEVFALLQERTDPFVVDAICPMRLEQISEGWPKE
jgi:hypothetical protein